MWYLQQILCIGFLSLFSDGVIRVFSQRPERQADESMQKAFEEEVAASTIPAQATDIPAEHIASRDALLNPGTG